MRPIATLSLLCLLAACGGEPAAPAAKATEAPAAKAEGTVYGPGVTEGDVLTVPQLLAKLDEVNGQRVRVKGLVTDVCAKRGCWIKVGDEAEPRTVTFKVTDGVIVFPMSAKGKRAKVEGILTVTKGTETTVQIKGEGAIVY